MNPRTILALAAVCGLLAACNGAPPPVGPAGASSVRQDSGINATGSVGMSGGAAAAPASAGSLTTTHP